MVEKIQVQNWQAVKKPFSIKTICVHLNLLAGLAIHRQTQGRRQ